MKWLILIGVLYVTWTTIVAFYDSAGVPIVPEPSAPTWVNEAWDSLIDELRLHLEDIALMFWGYTDLWVLASDEGWSLSDWTKGINSPKRLSPMNGGNGDDAFYVSHVSDLRTVINGIEAGFLTTASSWSYDPIVYKYDSVHNLQEPFDDISEDTFLEEPRAAVGDLLRMPINFREQP